MPSKSCMEYRGYQTITFTSEDDVNNLVNEMILR